MYSKNPNIEWLIQNGSAAIKFRTLKEILGESPS
jgi:hypothetical protein